MKTINVVAAIIHKDDEIFATQRGYGDFEGGWEFPGGKIEEGEEPEAAVVREIQEELETTVNVEKFLIQVEHDYETFHLTMKCYVCSIAEGDLKLLEHKDAKWLNAESIDSVDWLPADIAVVEAIKAQGILC